MIKQHCVFKNEMIENIKDLKHLRIIFQVQSLSKSPKKLKNKTKQQQTNKQTRPCMGSGVRGHQKNKANCRLSARSFR